MLYPGRHEPLVSPETWQKVQEILAARNIAGDKQRDHNHYLKGSVYCGTCQSRLIVSHAKNRHGTVYPYFICLGRQQKRTDCRQQAIRINQAEDAVARAYASIHLTPEQAEQVRAFVLNEMTRLHATTETERTLQERRLAKLRDERKKLLDAHYADAIPLDLLKAEQARIAAEATAAEARLGALQGNFSTAEGNLAKALSLVQNCEAAYLSASDKLRRQFNQAFFKRILIDDTYTVTGELAEPFDTLLSEEIRLAAARRAHLELIDAVEAVFRAGDGDTPLEPELALASATRGRTPPTSPRAQGLKEKILVGGGEGTRTPEPLDCQSSALPTELRPQKAPDRLPAPAEALASWCEPTD